MPRLAYGLEIDDMQSIWSRTGDPLPPEDPSINLDRSTGFTPAMSLPGGPPVPRQVFNWSWRVFSTLGSEVNQHGVLEWSDQVNYLHTASVAKNGRSFISTVNSGPGVPIGPQDPELAEQTAWVELLRVGILRWNDIDGILPVAKGGTGVSSIPSLRALLNIPEPAQGTLPIGGDRGEVLQKTGSGDFVVDWQRLSWDDIDGVLTANRGGTGATSIASLRVLLNIPDVLGGTLPTGGDVGEVLQKTGSGDYAAGWDRLSWDDIDGVLPANRGGTGATSIATLRVLLNIPDYLTGSTLPIGGDVGEVLQKTGSGDYVVDWQTPTFDDIDGILELRRGGTGATSAAGARSSLGAARSGHAHGNYALDSHMHPDPSLPDLSGVLPLYKGGTGATNQAGARGALGLGTSATRDTGTVDGQVPLVENSDLLPSSILPVASTTMRGIVELETTAETRGGTGTTKGVTGAGVRSLGDTRYIPRTARLTVSFASPLYTGSKILTATPAPFYDGKLALLGSTLWIARNESSRIRMRPYSLPDGVATSNEIVISPGLQSPSNRIGMTSNSGDLWFCGGDFTNGVAIRASTAGDILETINLPLLTGTGAWEAAFYAGNTNLLYFVFNTAQARAYAYDASTRVRSATDDFDFPTGLDVEGAFWTGGMIMTSGGGSVSVISGNGSSTIGGTELGGRNLEGCAVYDGIIYVLSKDALRRIETFRLSANVDIA